MAAALVLSDTAEAMGDLAVNASRSESGQAASPVVVASRRYRYRWRSTAQEVQTALQEDFQHPWSPMSDMAVGPPEDADDMDGGAASRKRGAPPTSDGSCWKQAKCEHGRIKRICKECGGPRARSSGEQGSDICPHGREKHTCEDCCGSHNCPHGSIKRTCEECGGSDICPHGREKHT